MLADRIMKILLLFIVLFNIVDLIFSTLTIYYGELEELNPVMEMYLNLGIIPFIIVKSVLVGGGCIILWRYREKLIAKIGAFIAFNYYLLLMIYIIYFCCVEGIIN